MLALLQSVTHWLAMKRPDGRATHAYTQISYFGGHSQPSDFKGLVEGRHVFESWGGGRHGGDSKIKITIVIA